MGLTCPVFTLTPGPGTIQVTITPVSGETADDYTIDVYSNSGGTGSPVATSIITTTTHTFGSGDGLAASTQYWVRVTPSDNVHTDPVCSLQTATTGALFNPLTDLPNLWIGVEADSGVTGTTSVTQWNDGSGNANHLITESGLPPTLFVSAINGKPSIGINAAVARMRTAATFQDAEQSVTVYMVAKQKVGAGALADASGHFLSTGADSLVIKRNSTNAEAYGQFKDSTSMVQAVTDNTWFYLKGVFSNGDVKWYVNGTLVSSNTNSLFDFGSDRLNLFSNATGGNSGNKEIALLFVSLNKNNSTVQGKMDTYVHGKYNL